MAKLIITAKRDEERRLTIYQLGDNPEAILEITDDEFREIGQAGCEKKFHEWCDDCRARWAVTAD